MTHSYLYEKRILFTERCSFAIILQVGMFTLTFIWVGQAFKFYCMVYKIISVTWTEKGTIM